MFDEPAIPDNIRDGRPLTFREQRILRALDRELSTPHRTGRGIAGNRSMGSRNDPPAFLVGGLTTLLVAAISLSVLALAVGATVCLGAVLAAAVR